MARENIGYGIEVVPLSNGRLLFASPTWRDLLRASLPALLALIPLAMILAYSW
jgi:hypothetical protein